VRHEYHHVHIGTISVATTPVIGWWPTQDGCGISDTAAVLVIYVINRLVGLGFKSAIKPPTNQPIDDIDYKHSGNDGEV